MSKLRPLTLDLAENARYSLHFLSHNLDPEYKWYTCHKTFYDADLPYHQHTLWDHCETPGRYLYGIVFARQLVGPDEIKDTEKKIKRNVYRQFDCGDGLCHRPPLRYFGPYPEFPPKDAIPVKHDADMWDNRSVLMGLFLTGYTEGDKKAMQYAKGMVKAFKKVSIRRGDEVYLTTDWIKPGFKPSKKDAPLGGEHLYGWITPLFNFYKLTGDKEALALAKGVCNFTVRHPELDDWGIFKKKVNIHSILFCLAGILRVATHTGNKKHIVWCKKMYDSIVKHWGTSFGWVAEHQNDSRLDWPGARQSGETCTTADFIDTAIRLALAGFPQYWNHAERYVRNYLQEAQLKDTSWMKPGVKKKRSHRKFVYGDIPDMVKGCYVGWGAPNDFVNPHARKSGLYALQHCCGPHGAMANFLVWHHIITKNNKGLSVNFAISRDSKWATVDSYQPYQGRVNVTMKVDDNLQIRVPDWVQKNKVKLNIDGVAKKAVIGKDNFVKVGKVKAGAKVSVQYPLRKMKLTEKFCGWKFTTEWRGDTVISIDPPGKRAPFFKRKHLKTDKCPMGEIERYYPENELDW